MIRFALGILGWVVMLLLVSHGRSIAPEKKPASANVVTIEKTMPAAASLLVEDSECLSYSTRHPVSSFSMQNWDFGSSYLYARGKYEACKKDLQADIFLHNPDVRSVIITEYTSSALSYTSEFFRIFNGEAMPPDTCWEGGEYCYGWGVAEDFIEFSEDNRVSLDEDLQEMVLDVWKQGLQKTLENVRETKGMYGEIITPIPYRLCAGLRLGEGYYLFVGKEYHEICGY